MTVVKRGLTLGKYAPLHLGHQFVIETALAEMDEVVVIIYDAPETTNIPLLVRANWLRQIYPNIQVIEAWNGPTEVGDTDEIRQKHEHYILNHLKITGITHFYSSEFYGDHMSKALGAVNRLVDVERQKFPISATQIRTDYFSYRQFIHPIVYSELITKVVFLGAPSTGKTTIASLLASDFQTIWMPEYGREYWEKNQIERRLSLGQLLEIAEGHLFREAECLQKANGYLFVDTNALTTYRFSLYYHQDVLPSLKILADQTLSRYDIIFLCETDIPYDDTWDRSGDANRLLFQKQIVSDLITRKIPFFRVFGDIPNRIKFIKTILAQYRKYENLPEWYKTVVENEGSI